MKSHVVGSKIVKKEQVLISIFLIAILVLSSGSMVAFAKNNVHVVKPNGVDDTSDIQNALNSCVGAGPWCTVQLTKGTFYITSQITVYGFQGTFLGAGQGQTTVEVPLGTSLASPAAADNVPCTLTGSACTPETGTPYWAGLPGPSDPWPAMFTFFGGSISISDMTITDPNSVAISPGWYEYQDSSLTQWTSLFAAVMVTGGTPSQPRASAIVDHVTFLGASGDLEGTNMWNEFYFGGSLAQPGNNYFDPIFLPGTLSVTNSVFESAASGPWVGDTIGSTITICYNAFVNDPGTVTGFSEISNTKITFCGNQDSTPAPYNVIGAVQGDPYATTPVLPSTVYILNNNFQVSESGSAVGLEDATPFYFPGTPSTLSAVIAGNTFQNNYAGAPPCCALYSSYYSVIWTISLESVAISGNNILAGGSPGIYLRGSTGGSAGTVMGNIITGANAGVWLDDASGVRVAANVIGDSAQYGIALTSVDACGCPNPTPSSNNYIVGNIMHGTASAGYDLYWDQAAGSTNNHWCLNVYHTSTPSVLPGC